MIRLLVQHHDHDAVMRLYRAADVRMVTSLHDGMNLACKEFVAARRRARRAGLSRFAAAREMPEALVVNPYHVEETADALYSALTMPPAEQRERMATLRSTVQEFNAYRWAGRMLADAARLRLRLRVSERAAPSRRLGGSMPWPGSVAASCRRPASPACRPWSAAPARRTPAPRSRPLLDARSRRGAIARRRRRGRRNSSAAPAPRRATTAPTSAPRCACIREDVRFEVTNGLQEETTVHWHGLLVPSHVDGGPHNAIAPGAAWRPTLSVRQPATTAWYHAHPHGRTGAQVYSACGHADRHRPAGAGARPSITLRRTTSRWCCRTSCSTASSGWSIRSAT